MLTNANKGTYLVKKWQKHANVIYEQPLKEYPKEQLQEYSKEHNRKQLKKHPKEKPKQHPKEPQGYQ